jgi:hydroxymethylglutaryl-CoA synthase
MAGILACGAYIPRFRLGKETAGWGSPLEKAVANFDEDSITMAVAAAQDCLRGLDRSQVDALYFATTTPPYLEQQASALIAEALDLRPTVFATDITNTLRGGTIALRAALDAVMAGSARQALVVAADSRMSAPRGEWERSLGDGAAAVLVGREGGGAEILASHTMTEHMLDTWRTPQDLFVRSWEDRFIAEEGYQRVVPQVVSEFSQRHGVVPKDIDRVALYAPDARRHQDMARRLGFRPEQVVDPLFGKVGNTGAAFTLLLLVSALETAKPGDRILAVGYGDGGDVFLLRATEGVERVRSNRRLVSRHVEAKCILPTYETYARWREVWVSEAARRPPPPMPSVSALWREKEANIRFYGSRCNACGYTQYPPQRVCTKCQAVDQMTPVRLAETYGTVFTYSMDYLAGTIDTPLVVAVVNFEGGGRWLGMMTDREISEVRIGMPVELTFRKLRTVGGVHNYYWKCMPVRA